jgi:hypothetical protein
MKCRGAQAFLKAGAHEIRFLKKPVGKIAPSRGKRSAKFEIIRRRKVLHGDSVD